MYSKTAELYDKIYGFKDYNDEARRIRELISLEVPYAKTVLDVACGTAEHAKLLSAHYSIDGIDLQPEFVDIAAEKVPSGTFKVADMRSFDMGKRYDVVQCLFSSIGYLLKEEDVVQALECFKRHLNPGGVILVEPWFQPERWTAGLPWMVTVEEPNLKICRMNVSENEGRVSVLNFHYLIADPSGVSHFEEKHLLALYKVEEMLSFFEKAELAVTYDPEGIFGRGMYVARLKS
jgi:ubiquinone/menaquinone biosynthesis C-methylase UbiE